MEQIPQVITTFFSDIEAINLAILNEPPPNYYSEVMFQYEKRYVNCEKFREYAYKTAKIAVFGFFHNRALIRSSLCLPEN